MRTAINGNQRQSTAINGIQGRARKNSSTPPPSLSRKASGLKSSSTEPMSLYLPN
jgi:hypothetical protein